MGVARRPYSNATVSAALLAFVLITNLPIGDASSRRILAKVAIAEVDDGSPADGLKIETNSPFATTKPAFTNDSNGEFTMASNEYLWPYIGGDGVLASLIYGENTLTGVGNFPAMDGMPLTIQSGTMEPCTAAHPHSHPFNDEWGTLIKGNIVVYVYSEEEDTLYSSEMSVGQSWVFPKGMIHFFKNIGPEQAMVVGGATAALGRVDYADISKFTSVLGLPSDYTTSYRAFLRLDPEACLSS